MPVTASIAELPIKIIIFGLIIEICSLRKTEYLLISSTVAAIAEARSHGDLKENSEYHAAKEEQSHNEGRITEIDDIIARANVIDVTKLNNDGKVIFGSTVFLENLDNGEKISYKIVGKDEADLKQKLIFFQSPIGRGLIGKNKNDLVEITTPAGIKNFEIKDVQYI